MLVLYLYGLMQLYTCQSTLFEQTMNRQKTVKNMVQVPRVIVKKFFCKTSAADGSERKEQKTSLTFSIVLIVAFGHF